MIRYTGGAFGFKILFRVHGSALFKASVPALISTGICIGLHYGIDENEFEDNFFFANPYVIGVIMVAFTFLLSFKASFSYNRYWEACTAVHAMQSNWVDVGTELAAFHLQSKAFDKVRPPAFGSHPEIKSIRERDRFDEMTPSEMIDHLDRVVKDEGFFRNAFKRRTVKPAATATQNVPALPKQASVSKKKSINAPLPANRRHKKPSRIPFPPFRPSNSAMPSTPPRRGIARLESVAVLDGGMLEDEPSLFLQEASHLLSLLCAVAFSTLRNDLEEADSPLVEYQPGTAWPPVDPDECDDSDINIRREYYDASRVFLIMKFLCGYTRSERNRCLYNAARPFRVLGGVSDAEIQLLQSARGPLAKVALCIMWMQEFIAREYMAGSTGAVAPPIISRLYCLLSNGISGYNQARKIAFIPFPFPHNQLTSFFIIIVMVLIPILMVSLVTNEIFGALLTFVTVLGFTGLHEVARELEDPFRNVPNDIPLNNLQAKYNEALVVMFSGFHPEAWWKLEGRVKVPEAIKDKSELMAIVEEVCAKSENCSNNDEGEVEVKT